MALLKCGGDFLEQLANVGDNVFAEVRRVMHQALLDLARELARRTAGVRWLRYDIKRP